MLRFLLKYKIIHFFAWLTISFLLTFLYYDQSESVLPQWAATLVLTAMAAPACWLVIYRLLPGLLYRKKILLFIGYMLLTILINTVATYLVGVYVYHLLTGLPMARSTVYVFTIANVIFWDNVFLITVGCAVKIIVDRFSMEQRLLEVEREQMSTELNFLRSQINPHFLFNVINTIYFQIEKENKSARSSVETLSEMLRYQLYECTSDRIGISKELDYLRNYVAIQTLRLEKDTDVQLHINDNVRGFTIAPLLLLPLVENAFKHISHRKEARENKIHISLENTNGCFIARVQNTYDKRDAAQYVINSGGLGMNNVQRRLDLLYPGKHRLEIEQDEHFFETTLNIFYD